jgi:hypothetical protein
VVRRLWWIRIRLGNQDHRRLRLRTMRLASSAGRFRRSAIPAEGSTGNTRWGYEAAGEMCELTDRGDDWHMWHNCGICGMKLLIRCTYYVVGNVGVVEAGGVRER